MSRHSSNHQSTCGRPGATSWSCLAFTFAAAGIAGCSSNPAGEVVMKIDERTAHISAAPGSLKRGDSVVLVESRCPRGPVPNTTRKPSSDNCKKSVRGTGTITEVLNEEYAVAEFPARLGFEEGDAVEPSDRVPEWEDVK